MEAKQLALIINEQKSSVPEIEQPAAKVGHETPNVKATAEVYENLHTFCSYDRE